MLYKRKPPLTLVPMLSIPDLFHFKKGKQHHGARNSRRVGTNEPSYKPQLLTLCLSPALTYCSRPLEDGDIVNVDVTVYLDGFHGDTSRTFLVGNVVSI